MTMPWESCTALGILGVENLINRVVHNNRQDQVWRRGNVPAKQSDLISQQRRLTWIHISGITVKLCVCLFSSLVLQHVLLASRL